MALIRGLTMLWRGVFALREDGLDDYLLTSELKKTMRSAEDDLYASGIMHYTSGEKHLTMDQGPNPFLTKLQTILEVPQKPASLRNLFKTKPKQAD